VKTQLLCTFTTIPRLSITVDNIIEVYDVVYGKMFVLENVDSDNELVCTYNIEAGPSTNKIPNTISLHRKKHTNTIYTYRDCILLTNDQGLNRINTKIKEIIRIKTKN
jgi:hypothetical protein